LKISRKNEDILKSFIKDTLGGTVACYHQLHAWFYPQLSKQPLYAFSIYLHKGGYVFIGISLFVS